MRAVGLGYLHSSHRLRPVSRCLDLLALRRPVRAGMGGPVLHGHAVYARRPLVGLHPLPCPRQVVSGQHRLQQFLVCRFVWIQGAVRAARPRIFPGRGRQCAFGRHRLLLVSRSEALQWPDAWPPTTASADFCGLTPCITARRAVWSDGSGPIRSLEIGLLDLAPGRIRYGTTRPSLPSAPHRQGAQISPGRCANCRCTSAAFTVGCVPVGFAVMCQLASHPSALYAV